MVYDGNSLSTVAFGNYPAKVTTALTGSAFGVGEVFNKAVAGQTTTQMIANGANIDALFASTYDCYVIAWEGTNDIGNLQDATTCYNNIVSYCNARRTAGFNVLILTIIARDWAAGLETIRGTINTNIRANWATFADGIADVAADARLSDPLNTTYFTDGTHLTSAGNQVVADIVATALLGTM